MPRDYMRVFIAVDITNDDVLEKLVRARDLLLESKADLKPVSRENMHITLRFIGEIPSSLVYEICDCLKELKFSPFKVRVKGIGVFPTIHRPRVIWAGIDEGVEELSRLHDDVEKTLRRLHIPPQREKFIPHITLARVRSGRNIQSLIKIIDSIADQDFGEFVVNELVLKRSILTPQGPIYNDVCKVRAID